jgi:DNA polymerase I-like protein with 3'-5' exonuclease and polymerase domains
MKKIGGTMDVTFDIETSGLLDESAIDYTASPYTLRDSFKFHCIVIEVHSTREIIAFYDGDTILLDGRSYEGDGAYTTTLEGYEEIVYTHYQMSEFKGWVEDAPLHRVVAHNSINFDFLACKLKMDMDYTVEEDTWCGKEITIEDTLVTSKALNPDRFGGHSLDNLGKLAGIRKVEFRKRIHKDKRFLVFAPDMLYYCIYDVKVNTAVFHYLQDERAGWDWEGPIALEKAVAEIITRQEHRGFKFNTALAEENVKELDILREERRVRVTPILPQKVATKAFMKPYTPPKLQLKKDGEFTSHMNKFIEKHNGVWDELTQELTLLGQQYAVPMAQEPIVTKQDASIDDATHIKDWLVGMGWIPSEYKMKDLTTKQKKGVGKVVRTQEEYDIAVEKYVDQTLNCEFKDARCAHLKTTPAELKAKLLKKKLGRGVKVLTNPTFTVGQDKEMCPNLHRISERFPYVKDVVEYLTYKHRRNSILGGGLEWEDGDEADKGYMAYVREDGRIATPADSCGAATSRFKHKVVANIPRPSSLYGGKMRELFGVDDGFFQVGYDFDSLEAREEAHYCWRYDKDKEYCKSLTLEKPNDVHTKMASAISAIIQEPFGRLPAKSVKYGCTYGAQEAKVAQTIGKPLAVGTKVFNAFWDAAAPLKQLKERLTEYWKGAGGKKFILGIDGRKVPTRAEHAILNSLFQSAGVICAKRAMVIHDRYLRKEGLLVDFFKEDWRRKDFCQQLIGYHDEAQLEVRKRAVKFKVFPTEEEAQAYKDTADKIWSDIAKAKDGGHFIAYTRAGELASLAVKHAGEHYKLKVDLTAGYMIGRNWKDCH